MKIIWLGHGSFRFETGNLVLLLDPWLTGNPVLPEDRHDEATDGVTHILLTHTHFDHVADVLPLARKYKVPVVGQYDLMSHWAEQEGIETIGFNKGGTVDLGGARVSVPEGCKAWHPEPAGRTPVGRRRNRGLRSVPAAGRASVSFVGTGSCYIQYVNVYFR